MPDIQSSQERVKEAIDSPKTPGVILAIGSGVIKDRFDPRVSFGLGMGDYSDRRRDLGVRGP
jgi:hypothetical protein